MAKTQASSFISISTPLGPDVLILETMTGTERLSRPFRFQLDLLSESKSVKFDQIVGKRVTIAMDVPGPTQGVLEKRHINGFVSRFVLRKRDARYTYYQAEVVPWLWFLGRYANCRIFQEMTVPEIIKKVFTDRDMHDFRDALETRSAQEFPKLDYCVQYRERDIDFVSRLMEEHGITYFFEHDKDKHVLVLANSAAAFRNCPGQARIATRRTSTPTGPGSSPAW